MMTMLLMSLSCVVLINSASAPDSEGILAVKAPHVEGGGEASHHCSCAARVLAASSARTLLAMCCFDTLCPAP
eukprot:SAG25_NODE_2346_length_1697_cov_1.194618_3_plen_72_part_01